MPGSMAGGMPYVGRNETDPRVPPCHRGGHRARVYRAAGGGQSDPCVRRAAARPVGWRGNWTGCFPAASPPVAWQRRSKSIVGEVLYSARKPKGDDTAGALKPRSQSIVSWLILGPISPKDPRKALDEESLPNESALSPDEGDKAGEFAWTACAKDSMEQQWQRFGKHASYWSGVWTEALDADFSDGLDFAKVFSKGPQVPRGVAYAHVYLHSPRAGAIDLLVNHAQGMKIWLNGNRVYAAPDPVLAHAVLPYFFNLYEWHTGSTRSVRLDLAKGWNRLLLKVAQGDKGWSFDLRMTAPAEAGYTSRNIVWETPLPATATATRSSWASGSS